MVDIEILRTGTQRPKALDISRPLQNWLSSLNPDEVQEQIASGLGTPQFVLDVCGWTIEYGALPVQPEYRGEGRRLIGVYPMIGGFLGGEMLHLREIVKRKGRHYGSLDKPFVIAVLNTSGLVDENEVAEALLGSLAVERSHQFSTPIRMVRRRDGYWRQGPPKRGSRVSGVLHARNINPWRVAAGLPKLWINPWADLPMTEPLPFQTFTAYHTGEVYETQSGTAAYDLFGLSQSWPGFDR
jgi:hypothetical protein